MVSFRDVIIFLGEMQLVAFSPVTIIGVRVCLVCEQCGKRLDKSAISPPSCRLQKGHPTIFCDVVAHDLDLFFLEVKYSNQDIPTASNARSSTTSASTAVRRVAP